MAVKQESMLEIANREIVMTRIFNASPELVFKAWTQPAQAAQWWGRQGYDTTVHELEARPGGKWRIDQKTPDGTVYTFKGVYLQVIPNVYLEYTFGMEGDYMDGLVIDSLSFEDIGNGKTKLTARTRFESDQARDAMLATGMEDGANESMDRLVKYLELEKKKELHITRIINAPRELVFKAWTDPVQLAKWWGPHTYTNPHCELDPRPGGVFVVHMKGPDTDVVPCTGHFLEVDPPNRLVFSAGAFEDENGVQMVDNLNVVTFEDLGNGKTRLNLHVTVQRLSPRMNEALEGMSEGWTQTLERLESLF